MRKVFLLILLVIFSNGAFSQELNDSQFTKYSEMVLKELSNGNISKINNLLFSPPGTNDKTQKIDYLATNYTLQALSKHFGNIVSFQALNKKIQYVEMGFSKGDIEYWKQNNKFVRYSYQVSLSKEPEAYFFLDYFKYQNKYFLSRLTFALPTTTVDIQKKLGNFGSEVMGYVNSLISSLENDKQNNVL